MIKAFFISIVAIIGLWCLAFGYHTILNLSEEDGIIGLISKILSFSWVPGSGELGFSLIPIGIVGVISFYLIKFAHNQYSKNWAKYFFLFIVVLIFAYEGSTNLFINSNIEGYELFFKRFGYIQFIVVIACLINTIKLYNVSKEV
jgi:hypothetical protein